MKVNNSNNKPVSAAQVKSKDLEKLFKSKDNDQATALKSGTSGSAKVDMSPNAQALSKAKALASNDSVDEAKVARLQALIDQGKYKVDAASVADRLVDEHISAGE